MALGMQGQVGTLFGMRQNVASIPSQQKDPIARIIVVQLCNIAAHAKSTIDTSLFLGVQHENVFSCFDTSGIKQGEFVVHVFIPVNVDIEAKIVAIKRGVILTLGNGLVQSIGARTPLRKALLYIFRWFLPAGRWLAAVRPT